MKYVKWYSYLFFFCTLLYIIMTLVDWYVTGRPDKAELRQFIVVLGGMTAVIGFLSRWVVDTDKDGVPDEVKKDPLPKPPIFTRKEN